MARQRMKQAASTATDDGATKVDPAAMRKELLKDIPADRRPQIPFQELTAQRILRADDSERQLQRGHDRLLVQPLQRFRREGHRPLPADELRAGRDPAARLGTLRRPAHGHGEIPAMLFYLDNWRSVGRPRTGRQPPRAAARAFAARHVRSAAAYADASAAPASHASCRLRTEPEPQQNKRGLNENYARELMELHTLGVDGGYTQQDVTEVARVFTGWTHRAPRQGGGFVFRAAAPRRGTKTVLGVHFQAGGGIEEGEDDPHARPPSGDGPPHRLRALSAASWPTTRRPRSSTAWRRSSCHGRRPARVVSRDVRVPEFWDPQNYAPR